MGFRLRGSTNGPAAGSTSCSPGRVAKPPTPTPGPEPSADLVAAALPVCGLGCVVW